MDSFNKIVSFVLGLVVVIVFLAIITGRLSVGKGFKGLLTRSSATPTTAPRPTIDPKTAPSPTSVPTVTRRPTLVVQRSNINTPKSIPATGSPTLLLPILLSSLSLGIYFKSKK